MKWPHTGSMLLLAAGAAGFFSAPKQLPAQAVTPTSAGIVGSWVAEHRSQGGIGSRWQFRPDGTLTMWIGAMVDSPYTLEGDRLTLHPRSTAPDAKPQVSKIALHGDKLCLSPTESGPPENCLTRVGTATPEAPLLGSWKPEEITATAPPSETAEQKQQRETAARIYKEALWTFTPAGILKLRIPFRSFEGTWDKAAQTFSVTMQGKKTEGKFHLEGDKLVLSQADGKTGDTYLRDDP